MLVFLDFASAHDSKKGTSPTARLHASKTLKRLAKRKNEKCKLRHNKWVFYDRCNLFLGEKRVRGGAF